MAEMICPRVAGRLLAARPGKFPRTRRAPKLSSTCRALIKASWGPSPPRSGQRRPTSGSFELDVGSAGQKLPIVGHHWPTCGKLRPTPHNLGIRGDAYRNLPKSATVVPDSAKLGQVSAQTGQRRGQTRANIGPNLEELAPNFGTIRAKLGRPRHEIYAIVARFRSLSGLRPVPQRL